LKYSLASGNYFIPEGMDMLVHSAPSLVLRPLPRKAPKLRAYKSGSVFRQNPSIFACMNSCSCLETARVEMFAECMLKQTPHKQIENKNFTG
jgi:hypothetical protein